MPGKLQLSGPFEFCKVARLMRRMGLKGATRGKAARTTTSDRLAPWLGFVYVVFVIDTFARRKESCSTRSIPASMR
jgi:transposase InsO family protein